MVNVGSRLAVALVDAFAGLAVTAKRWRSQKEEARQQNLEHDPEKWTPIFRKRSCSNKKDRAR
jgi:hypothetical protein